MVYLPNLQKSTTYEEWINNSITDNMAIIWLKK